MPADLTGLTAALGTELDADLVERAVTHRSFAYENGGLPTNERLEFLGDSVLGLVITEELFRRHPDLPEGQLAKLRAAVVNSRALAEAAVDAGARPEDMRALADVSRDLSLGALIRLGRGEESTGGRDKSSILADAVEALIGAVYLDRGADEARSLVLRLFAALLDSAAQLGAGLDWKTSLQELAAGRLLGVPEYRVSEAGPDHAKTFQAVALVGGRPVGHGDGRSKKEAEQRAAAQAWSALSADADGAAVGPGDTDPAATEASP